MSQVSVYDASGGDVDLTADVEGFYYGAVGTPTVHGALQTIAAARVVDTFSGRTWTAIADPPVLGTAIAVRDDVHALSCATPTSACT